MKGVHYHKRDKCWNANIMINGRRIYIGSFKNRFGCIHMIILKSEELGRTYKKDGWEYKGYLEWLENRPNEILLAQNKMIET